MGFTQLLLFDTARTLRPRSVADLTARADPDLAVWAEQFTAARSRQHGWNPACTGRVRTAVNVMLAFQSAPAP